MSEKSAQGKDSWRIDSENKRSYSTLHGRNAWWTAAEWICWGSADRDCGMSKLTIISSKDMVKILENLGFEEIRQKWSHKFFFHNDGRTTIVPYHGEDLGRGLIRKILRDIEITVEEYEELRKSV